MRRLRLGALDAVVTGPDAPGPVVVLMHGFGAPGDDLVSLGQALSAPAGTRFVFPEAPLDLGPQFFGGRAWWEIDMVKLQMALATGAFRNLSEEVPPGLDAARDALLSLLDAVDRTLEPTEVVLGGFSQGSMLAVDTVLRSERSFAGLICLSPTVIAEALWKPRFSGRAGLPVVITHGRMDPVLPFEGAERLRDLFMAGGAEVEFVPFNGQHEIPQPALLAVHQLLNEVLAQ